MYTTKKLVIAGDVVSLYSFENGVRYGKRKSQKINDDKKRENTLDSRKRSFYRARKKIINLVNTNCYAWKKKNGSPYLPLMYSFTFKADVRDVQVANAEFTKFIQRLNYHVTHKKNSYLKYVTVIEFQDLNRRVIHYHTLFFNLPYFDFFQLSQIWGHGYAQYEKITDPLDMAKYISKYVSKSFDDDRLCGEKCYFISRNLKQPIIVHDYYDVMILQELLPKPFYEDSYDSEYQGQIDVAQFYLKDGEYTHEDIMKVLAVRGYSVVE